MGNQNKSSKKDTPTKKKTPPPREAEQPMPPVENGPPETAPRESEEIFHNLAELSPEPVVILQDGQLRFVNSAFQKTFGYTRRELKKKTNFLDFVDEKNRPEVIRRYADRLAGKEVPTMFQLNVVGKNGGLFPCETLGALIRYEGRPADLVIVRHIGERKRTEEELKKSKEMLSAFMNSTSESFSIFDSRLNLIEINEAGLVYWPGSKKKDLLGKHITEMVPNLKDTGRIKIYENVITTGEPYASDDVMPGEQFGDVYFEVKAFKVADGMGIIVSNVTARKQAEKKLEQMTHDLGERVKELNCLYGISSSVEEKESLEEILRGTVELIPPGWQYPEITCARIIVANREYNTANFKRSPWKQNDDILVKGKKFGTLQVFYLEKRPNEAEGPFLAEERILLNAICERLGRVIERKQAEEKLRQSEERFRVVTEHSTDITVILDEEGIYRYVSPAVKLYGYTPAQIAGKSLTHFVHPGDLPAVQARIEEVLARPGETIAIEAFRARTAAGDWMYLEGIGTCLLHVPGVKGIVFNGRDVTERKRAREALEHKLIALTQPGVELDDIELPDIVGIDMLQTLQDAFADSYGVPTGIYGVDGKAITKPSRDTRFCELVHSTPAGRAACEAFDKEVTRELGKKKSPVIRCGCVFRNILTGTVPIVIQGRHIANWSIGQLFEEELYTTEIKKKAREFGIAEEELLAAEKTLIPARQVKFAEAIKFLDVLAKQIGLLGLQNLQQARLIHERKQAEERLKESLKEKEVLLKEVHHRVKNNLQLIDSLLSLQLRRLKEKESAAVLKEVKNRISSISLIHEKIYRSPDLANINFGEYISTLTSHLLQSSPLSLSAVRIKTEVTGLLIKLNKAIPCALLVNELVTNSLKYAFPAGNKGEIVVGCSSGPGGEVALSVADDGAGLPEGFDIESSNTLGMQIVKALSKQLRGTLHIDQNREKGVKFTIRFQPG
ncbi:MAG: PAS domain S-box protein [Candidatus Aminicenantes bacterium]|nr:PAS domain S-box protein [Candidatus Aminicenantes bacterium]